MKSEELAEGLAAAGLSALFFWGLRFFPFLGLVAIPAAALPLVRFAGRRGLRPLLAPLALAASASGAVAFTVASLGPGPPRRAGGPSPLGEALLEAAVYLGMIGACAAAAALSRRVDPSSAFMGLILYGAVVIAAIWLAVPGIELGLLEKFDAISKSWMDSLRQSGEDPAALRSWQSFLESGHALAASYAPGLLAVCWILLAAPSFFLGRRLARMAGSFSDFRVPPLVAMLFVVSGAVAVLLRGGARRIAGDVLAPLIVLYFLAGLSIITHFARRFLRLGMLRAALYVAVSLAPFSAVTAGLGLFDWYFDFRRRAGREEKER